MEGPAHLPLDNDLVDTKLADARDFPGLILLFLFLTSDTEIDSLAEMSNRSGRLHQLQGPRCGRASQWPWLSLDSIQNKQPVGGEKVVKKQAN